MRRKEYIEPKIEPEAAKEPEPMNEPIKRPMDIDTPRGQISLDHEKRAIELLLKQFPKYEYVETNKKRPAAIDGIVSQYGVATFCVEHKSRPQLTHEEFQRRFASQWLITYDKLVRASQIAEALQIPFVGLLYLPADDVLLMKKLYSPINGEGWAVPMQIKVTQTQATINGGLAVRSNAYVDMSRCFVIRGDKPDGRSYAQLEESARADLGDGEG